MRTFLTRTYELIKTGIALMLLLFIIATVVYYLCTGDFILHLFDANITNHWHQTPNVKPKMFR